jgi:hypothetical protein
MTMDVRKLSCDIPKKTLPAIRIENRALKAAFLQPECLINDRSAVFLATSL